MSEREGKTIPKLADVQDVEVNYYVLVPFTTVEAATWAADTISSSFDVHVVGIAAVDQNTLDYYAEGSA